MDPAYSTWPTGTPDPHPKVESPAEKPKKPRHRHSAIQLAALNELYDRNEHPSLDARTSLAEKLGMYALFRSSFSPIIMTHLHFRPIKGNKDSQCLVPE